MLGAIVYVLIVISLASIAIVVANVASIFLGVDKPLRLLHTGSVKNKLHEKAKC